MVPLKNRLPYKEFRARGYSRVTTPYFLVKTRRNTLGYNRFGFVISASSVKNAARRNLLRRQLKTVLLSEPQKGFDILIVVQPRAALPPKNVFQKTLRDAITPFI